MLIRCLYSVNVQKIRLQIKSSREYRVQIIYVAYKAQQISLTESYKSLTGDVETKNIYKQMNEIQPSPIKSNK